MKYKVEVVVSRKVVREFVYNKMTHPRQAVRKAVQFLGSKLNYYIIYIANEYGEAWSYVVRKGFGKVMSVRPMKKYGYELSRDDIDMVFTGNQTIMETIKK